MSKTAAMCSPLAGAFFNLGVLLKCHYFNFLIMLFSLEIESHGFFKNFGKVGHIPCFPGQVEVVLKG